MVRIVLLVFFSALSTNSFCQYQWKLQKDKDGIQIYLSDVSNSKFKAVKVECTFSGTYIKLFSLLTNVARNSEWVYNSKTNYILKQTNPLDFYYYTETHFPWPLSNRDVVIHDRIRTDSMPKFFTVAGTGEPNFIPEKPGKVRLQHYSSYWKVTMPTQQSVHIYYILEADPGGDIPPWLSNDFVDKGPFETFKKLGEMLGK